MSYILFRGIYTKTWVRNKIIVFTCRENEKKTGLKDG